MSSRSSSAPSRSGLAGHHRSRVHPAVLPRHGLPDDARAGSPFRYVLPDGEVAVEGTVEEVDAPRRLVTTWRVLYDAAMAAEPPSRVEWRLEPAGDGLTKLTASTSTSAAARSRRSSVGSGWPWVLGSLKSLLETGEGLPRPTAEPVDAPEDVDGEAHRRFAVEANNAAWELLGRDDLDGGRGRGPDAPRLRRRVPLGPRRPPRTGERGPGRVPDRQGALAARAARRRAAHARRCLAATAAAGLVDFDLAYAHEVDGPRPAAGRPHDDAAVELGRGDPVPIADAEDEEIVDADFADFAFP